MGLTPYAVEVDRALAAVATVNDTLDKDGRCRPVREIKAAFRAARSVDPSLRYADYIEARKAAMLEALAREAI